MCILNQTCIHTHKHTHHHRRAQTHAHYPYAYADVCFFLVMIAAAKGASRAAHVRVSESTRDFRADAVGAGGRQTN